MKAQTLRSAIVMLCIAAALVMSFSAAHSSASERQWENLMMAVPSAADVRSFTRAVTWYPHIAGTPGDDSVTRIVAKRWRAVGADVRIESFTTLLTVPIAAEAWIIKPSGFHAATREPALPGDPDTANPAISPEFNMWSASGDVTALLVYVGYGLPRDYEWLASKGMSVRGDVVLIRYGKGYRGDKVLRAQRHGAAAVLLYSDPADDGAKRGTTYPNGPYRNPNSVQRGSVAAILTSAGIAVPGVSLVNSAADLRRNGAPRIPVRPLSAADAAHFISALGGTVAPKSWQGGLPTPYRIGDKRRAVARVRVMMNLIPSRLHDVLAEFRGSQYPDERIVLGCHRDAWVFGAADDTSGCAALTEVVRSLAKLSKLGWRPKRTVLIAAWDGEEVGLMGSTWWAKTHEAELARGGVAYINADDAAGGVPEQFAASGTPLLSPLLIRTTRDVSGPRSGSIYDQWHRESKGKTTIDPIGGGGDFYAFANVAGIPTSNPEFGGFLGGYHSAYDDFRSQSKFIDPEFRATTAAARLYGALALRLAGADRIPYSWNALVESLQADAAEARASATKAHLRVTWSRLDRAIADLRRSVRLADSADDAMQIAAVRALIVSGGLPGAPDLHSILSAPQGYAAMPLPLVNEAIVRRDGGALQRGINATAAALARAAHVLRGD